MKYETVKVGTTFYVVEEGTESGSVKRQHMCKCRFKWQADQITKALNDAE